MGIDLSAYLPVPHDESFTEHLSVDAKGVRYRFRRWVASKLDLRMPNAKQPIYFKNRNANVAQFMSLERDLGGTDLAQIIRLIANRARASAAMISTKVESSLSQLFTNV